MNTEFELRNATLDDAEGLASLFAEDWAYYNLDVPPRDDILAHIKNDVLSASAGADVLYALDGETPAGFAISAVLYPAPGGTGQMFMKELFITEAYRGTGLGTKMMRTLARRAVELGCSRLDWTAETTNPKAVAYYHKLGATLLDVKKYFRLDGETLKDFAD